MPVKVVKHSVRAVERVSMLSIDRCVDGKKFNECLFVHVYGDTPEDEAKSIEETLIFLHQERKKIAAHYLERRLTNG